MSIFRAHHRFAAWLAMCAMVLGALAPTVAQAMVAASGKAQWVEVCSASGMISVKLDSADQQGVSSDQGGTTAPDMSKHCPWCVFHGASAGLPTAEVVAPEPLALTQSAPVHSAPAFASLIWSGAQARAPPFAS